MILPIESMPSPAYATIPALVDTVFKPNGLLEKALGLEHRPQQYRMAMRVVRAMLDDTPLLFEAGTGVGKSLAYLVPGIIVAMNFKRPLVVATHTIALQEQIQTKDLKLCSQLFNTHHSLESYRSFKMALLVGRRNYLCPPRLFQAIATKADLFQNKEQDELERIYEWSMRTETGLLEELNPQPSMEVWDWVNADSALSNPKNTDCFYQKARAQMREANVIIVNHALLFSLINAGVAPNGETKGVLFVNDFVVLDEAHRIPGVATDHFGIRLSSFGIDRTLKMLYNPRRKKGLLSKYGADRDFAHVVKTIDCAETFFNQCRQTFLTQRAQVRLLEPNWGDTILLAPLKELGERLGALAQRIENESARDEIMDQRRRVLGYAMALESSLSLTEKEHVYWLEKSGKTGAIVQINAAPLDIAPYLRKALFGRNTSCVLTSATLASGGTMRSFQARAGAVGEDAEIVNSPFDYERNMQVRIARGMPVPTREEGRLDIAFLAEEIRSCISDTNGGVLALFTSYQDMLAVAERIGGFCEKWGRPLFVQGNEFGRTELTRRFAECGNGVLLGTDSFWTGVDVPGSALSHVVITRLPFENPSHPVLQARSEWMEQRGINPFTEMTLPDAVIKFRQGVGRLIRKHDDKGSVTILDSRILTKQYGKEFIAALPKRDYEVF